MPFFAHSENNAHQRHLLKEHLSSVSRLAEEFLAGWLGAQDGALAGLLHDLGKYGDLFQRRLKGEESGLDHWSQGAWLALTKYQSLAGALAIQGHHIGLQKCSNKQIYPQKLVTQHPLNLRLSEKDLALLEQRFKADGLAAAFSQSRLFPPGGGAARRVDKMLDIRRVFSALVDADFLDTEAHFEGDEGGKKYRLPGPKLAPAKALDVLRAYITKIERSTKSTGAILKTRQVLKNTCLEAASQPSGLFTLTAPTGSGKTLAMLAFALAHAARHGFERVVMVIPYLTIIEQTTATYRAIFESDFGKDYVLEHHSLAGTGAAVMRPETQPDDANDPVNDTERRRRLTAENWDAPIIVTTSVQLLESLFSNRPSACRKLHRLANSMILFDEVQTLPLTLAMPTLAALSHVASDWNSSVVFASATQPAFAHLHQAVSQQARQGWQPREIVPNHRALTERLRRVRYDLSQAQAELPWETLAGHMRTHKQVLCIVNLKAHAKTLWEHLKDTEDVFHLSTNLCPAHRQVVLAEVRARLKSDAPCRLISTQCVEAGVDIDFPVVWRAWGPLDAIIQAAGRCNREGQLSSPGQVVVFTPQEPHFPDPTYKQAASVAQLLFNEWGPEHFDPHDPDLIRRYYERLYLISDPESLAPKLTQAIQDGDFPQVAREYRLIQQDAINVLMPWQGAMEAYRDLRGRVDREGLTRDWVQKARAFSVSLYRPGRKDPIWDALLPVEYRRAKRRQDTDWYVYAIEEHYDDKLGLVAQQSLNVWIA